MSNPYLTLERFDRVKNRSITYASAFGRLESCIEDIEIALRQPQPDVDAIRRAAERARGHITELDESTNRGAA